MKLKAFRVLVQKELEFSPFLVAENRCVSESEWITLFFLEKKLKKKLKKSDLFFHQDEEMSPWIEQAIQLSQSRVKGVPLQYLLGEQEFYELTFDVGPGVLVPRPETEELVDLIINTLNHPLKGLELGLGSGAISISLLNHFEKLEMVGTEASKDALVWVKKNREKLLKNPNRLIISHSSSDEVFENINGTFDFIVSNPPYLGREDDVDSDVLAQEPKVALYPESEDPLYFYKKIKDQYQRLLKSGGFLFLEISSLRAKETEALFLENSEVECFLDRSKRPRILKIRKK